MVVVVFDVLGYFVGWLFGGLKFWFVISFKKMWFGMIVGWVGVVLVGLIFVDDSLWFIILVLVLMVFVG